MSEYILVLIWLAVAGLISIEIPKQKMKFGDKIEYRYKVWWAIIIMLPIIYWSGTRDYVGDTYNYAMTFKSMPHQISEIENYMGGIKKDKGFYFVSLMIKIFISSDTTIYFLVLAAIQGCILVKLYRKYSLSYLTSIFLFIASTDYISWMYNGIRQFTAVTITILAFDWALKKKYMQAVLIILFASLFHKQLVFHLIIESENELFRLKGTKYVQSRIENVFSDIKEFLAQNRTVLFSGTPCQVAGLKSFLGKEYDNLICVDLICHGVPSPKVWERYLKQISKGSTVEKVTFRNKSQGINRITLDYYLKDGNVIQENYADSLYMKGFIQNLYVRPSCFECKFKGADRCSDLTIGDFWAVKEYHPEFYNDKGVSAIIVHSEMGKRWIKKIEEELNIIQSSIKELACWNECLLESTVKNDRREDFFSQWNDEDLESILKELTTNYVKKEKVTVIQKIKRNVKKLFR